MFVNNFIKKSMLCYRYFVNKDWWFPFSEQYNHAHFCYQPIKYRYIQPKNIRFLMVKNIMKWRDINTYRVRNWNCPPPLLDAYRREQYFTHPINSKIVSILSVKWCFFTRYGIKVNFFDLAIFFDFLYWHEKFLGGICLFYILWNKVDFSPISWRKEPFYTRSGHF